MAKKNTDKVEKPTAEDAERQKIAKAWQKRIEAGIKAQEPWWQKGRELKKFIEGSQWNDAEDQHLPDSKWAKTTDNRMYALVNGYLATTVYRRPNVNAKPPRQSKEDMRKAQVDQLYLNYCLREGQYERHQRLSTYDAIVYGAGCREMRLDKERGGIAKAEWRSIEDVVVDPHANTVESSVGWVAIRFTMNVKTARRIYKAPTLQPDSKAKAQKDGPTYNSSHHVGGGLDEERVTLWRIWARGDDPGEKESEPDDGNVQKVEKGEGKAEENGSDGSDQATSKLQDYLERHGNRKFVVCGHHPEPLEDSPWPFVLDVDSFPVTFVRLHEVPGQFLPFSPLQPVKELQRQLNWSTTFLITQMRRISQQKLIANMQFFPDKTGKEEIQKLTTLESDEIVLAQGPLDRAIARVDLGQLSAPPLQMMQMLEDKFDKISGYGEMFGGMEGARSATEASIREERAQTLSDLMRQATESAANEDLRKMLQISFSATPVETVANIVGAEIADFAVDQVTGQKIAVATYWNENMTPEQIRAEVDVVLEPGSMRRVNRDQEVTDCINLMDRALGFIGQFPPLGLQPNPQAILDYWNSLWKRALDSLGWVDGHNFVIQPEMVGLAPQPEGNQTLQIDQSTHLTEGNKTLHEAAPTMTLHQPSPALSLSLKEGEPKQPIDRAKSPTGGM